MKLSGIGLQNVSKNQNLTAQSNSEVNNMSFKDKLIEAINKVNETEKNADAKTIALVKGEEVNLHDVMISAQKANIALETTVQVQKKAVDAYNEIMRMQI